MCPQHERVKTENLGDFLKNPTGRFSSMNSGDDNYIVSQHEKLDCPATGSYIHVRHGGTLSHPSSSLTVPSSPVLSPGFDSHTVTICASQ